ncbi:unnamed protein product [Heterobilharzia americana]|nr:unnamed protein product [Heterobilharzia americana]
MLKHTLKSYPSGKIRVRLIAEQMSDLLPKQNDQIHLSDKSFVNSTYTNMPPNFPSHVSSNCDHASYDPTLRQSHSNSNFGSHHKAFESLPQSHCMTTFRSHLFPRFSDKQHSDLRSCLHPDKSACVLDTDDVSDLSHVTAQRYRKSSSDLNIHEKGMTHSAADHDAPSSEVAASVSKRCCNSEDVKLQESQYYEESLEARIQKLLKLNSVKPASELSDAHHSPVVVDHNSNVCNALPITSETYLPTCVHNKPDDPVHSEKPSKTIAQKGNSHFDSSKNTRVVTSPSNRRTLLPTPEGSNETVKGPLFNPHRPPLLKTPYKSVDIQEVLKIIDDVHMVFVDELRGIIQRDVTRKLVEGQAFKLFSDWWDSKERECRLNHAKPLSTNSLYQTNHPTTKDDMCTNSLEKSNTSHEFTVLSRTDQNASTNLSNSSSIPSTISSNNPVSSMSENNTLSSSFKLFGLGMFTGLRSALPKIRRKPRPPSPLPPCSSATTSTSKNESLTVCQDERNTNSLHECELKLKTSPVWKSHHSRTQKDSDTSCSDMENDNVNNVCREVSESSDNESSTERSNQTTNGRVKNLKKSNECQSRRRSERSDKDDKCDRKRSQSKLLLKPSPSPENICTSDYASSNDSESIVPSKPRRPIKFHRGHSRVSDVFAQSSSTSSTGSNSPSDNEKANRYKKPSSDEHSEDSVSESRSHNHACLSPVETSHCEPIQNGNSVNSNSSPISSQSESTLDSEGNEEKSPETAGEIQKYQANTIFQRSPVRKPIHSPPSEVQRKRGRPRKNDQQSTKSLSRLSPQKDTRSFTGSLDSTNSSSEDDVLQMNNNNSICSLLKDIPPHNGTPTLVNPVNRQPNSDWSILRASLELQPSDYAVPSTYNCQLSGGSRRKQNLVSLRRNDNEYISAADQRNKLISFTEPDVPHKISLTSDQKLHRYPPYHPPRIPVSSEEHEDLKLPVKCMNTANNYFYNQRKSENLHDENADSDSTESVEIEEIVEDKYMWPECLLADHNYFRIPEIGSVIHYRSTKRVNKYKSKMNSKKSSLIVI